MSFSLRLVFNSFLFIFLIALIACNSSSNRDSEEEPPPSLQMQLQKVVDDAVNSGLPGVSLYVQIGDETVNIAGGVLNIESSEPMTTSTLFHAASVGKTFTSTMILRMVEMGLLRLEDPIDLWLDTSMSSMINNSDKITVRMLLASTSGIPDYYDSGSEFFANFAASAGRVWSAAELIEFIDGLENDFEPGVAYRYSNTNFVLLGVIAERITGLSFTEALRQYIFDPAQLQNTYGVFENSGQRVLSQGYVPLNIAQDLTLSDNLPVIGDDVDSSILLYSEGLGDASTLSTPSDLNLFIRRLIDTDSLVSGELKAEMMAESFPGASEYGLGLLVMNDNGLTFGHTGKGFGVHSAMIYKPSKNLSFATIVNGSFGDYDQLYDQYTLQLDLVLEQYLEN